MTDAEQNSARAAAPLSQRMARLWRPSGLRGGMVLAVYRAWLVTFPITWIAMVVVPIGLVVDWVLHREVVAGRLILALIAFAQAPIALRHVVRLLRVVPQGYWTRKGVPVRREEEPGRFWFWTAVEGCFGVAAPLVAAGVLIWFAATWR